MSNRRYSDQTRADELQWSDDLTAYDEAHLFIYARLLDGAEAEMTDSDMIQHILGLDPGTRGNQDALVAHLARARWMRDVGYAKILSSAG